MYLCLRSFAFVNRKNELVKAESDVDWYVSNGSNKIKFQENSGPIYYCDMEDFQKDFSDVDFHQM